MKLRANRWTEVEWGDVKWDQFGEDDIRDSKEREIRPNKPIWYRFGYD